MLLVGLTGGIGSGKSTVSEQFALLGAEVVDADAIVRQVQRPGTDVFAGIVERFGLAILSADGDLDRQALAAIVFSDADALADLNGLVHPAVGVEIERRLTEAAMTDRIVILDIPLLVESGRDDMAGIIVVDTDPDIAVERLVVQRGFSDTDARARMARQATRDERLAKADFVIDNNSDRIELEKHIRECWSWIATLATP
ncbi:MAG: dephospho-CoA kinase [Actinomycetes bacterium]